MTYETDKEVLGFVPEYQRIAGILGPAARVCEIGVLNGLGLAMLQDMYPDGIVAGVDFNPASHWPEGTVRIVTNQADPDLPAMLAKHSGEWDLVIDDASHRGSLTKILFKTLWPLVAPGGFYVVEDWFIGSPLWSSTGFWGGAPVGSQAVADSYDPEFLRVVQDLVLLLDKPYPGVGEPRALRDSEAESVVFKYGMVIVRKTS
jgi:hypothetical protein